MADGNGSARRELVRQGKAGLCVHTVVVTQAQGAPTLAEGPASDRTACLATRTSMARHWRGALSLYVERRGQDPTLILSKGSGIWPLITDLPYLCH